MHPVLVTIFLSAEKWVRGHAIDKGEIEIGTQQSQMVPPGLFWRFHMTVHHPTYIKFNLSLSHNALLGVYGRRNIPPTHTQVMAVMLFTQMGFSAAAPTVYCINPPALKVTIIGTIEHAFQT